VLLVLTGTGLKDAHIVAKHALPSPALEADLTQVLDFIASGYIGIQHDSFGKSRDTLTANLKLAPHQDKLMHEYLGRINRKGKTLSSNELEVLQSLVFAESDSLHYPVVVDDYDVNMRKNGLVHALVTLSVNGVEVKSSNHGVGPVDAVLGAIKKETDKLFAVEVKGHQIDILSPDTNSLVLATLTLGYNDQTVQVKAASPDVIEAAVNAFVKGIAILSEKG
jgi:threonine synthase